MRAPEVPLGNWDELVLPEDQRERLRAIPHRFRLRERRVTGLGPEQAVVHMAVKPVLFVGPPGTGKTLAAEIISAQLGLPVLELDLDVELQQTAEPEGAVARAFHAAERDGAILVVDGAGPLLRRPPPIDQPEGRAENGQRGQLLEASVDEEHKILERVRSDLLERSDQYDQLVIFTSTVTRGIDPAVADSFDVITFPFPDSELRKEIWRRSLPLDAQLTESTLDYLSNWLLWPGRTIDRCCRAAVDAAASEGVPVQLRHVAAVLHQQRFRTDDFPQGVVVPPPSPSRPDEPPRGNQIARTKWRRGLRVTALGAVVMAAVAGLVLAGTASTSSPSNAEGKDVHLSSARVSVPSNWRQERPPATPALGLTDELAVASPAPARGLLIMGKTAAASPWLLPRSLLATLPPAAVPQIVRVGRIVFYRYTDAPSGRATRESVLATPTTTGTIVGVCRTRGTASATFISHCERVLSTLKLTAGRALPPAMSASYAKTLNSVINQLNTVRASVGAQLAGATTARAQTAAATTLARAHSRAGSALANTGAGVASAANAALAQALLRTANAYQALATAAAHNDAHAYSAARAELARTAQALTLAFDQMRWLGYRVA